MTDAIDQRSFRRIIQRNIALPLVMGLVNVAVFIGLVVYLVSTMSWVEHSERVIGDANEMMRLAVERQSSSRGFFITGDERFLSQYEVGERQFQSELDSLMKLVQDNPPRSRRSSVSRRSMRCGTARSTRSSSCGARAPTTAARSRLARGSANSTRRAANSPPSWISSWPCASSAAPPRAA